MEKIFYIDLKGVITKEELYDLLKKELPLPITVGEILMRSMMCLRSRVRSGISFFTTAVI